MCQPLIDAVAQHVQHPMLNHTLNRTFGPAIQALHGTPIRYVQHPMLNCNSLETRWCEEYTLIGAAVRFRMPTIKKWLVLICGNPTVQMLFGAGDVGSRSVWCASSTCNVCVCFPGQTVRRPRNRKSRKTEPSTKSPTSYKVRNGNSVFQLTDSFLSPFVIGNRSPHYSQLLRLEFCSGVKYLVVHLTKENCQPKVHNFVLC